MPSSLCSEPPLTDLDGLEAKAERLLLGRLGLDWRDKMWAWRQQDLARWQQEADERQATIAAARERAEYAQYPRPAGGYLPQRLGDFVSHTRFHDYTSDYDAEAPRRPHHDPLNSMSLHPWWWIQNYERYAPRARAAESIAYDTNGEEYPLFQHDQWRPDFIPMTPENESEVEIVNDANQAQPQPEDEAARVARLRAENWQYLKEQFSSFGSAFRFVGRMLLRIGLGVLLLARRRRAW